MIYSLVVKLKTFIYDLLKNSTNHNRHFYLDLNKNDCLDHLKSVLPGAIACVELNAVDSKGRYLATLISFTDRGTHVHEETQFVLQEMGYDTSLFSWDNLGRIS